MALGECAGRLLEGALVPMDGFGVCSSSTQWSGAVWSPCCHAPGV